MSIVRIKDFLYPRALVSNVDMWIVAFVAGGHLIFASTEVLLVGFAAYGVLHYMRQPVVVGSSEEPLCCAECRVAMAFVMFFLMKLVSAVWAEVPGEAIDNAFNNVHFFLWPFLLPWFRRSRLSLAQIEYCIAVGLIVLGAWYFIALFAFPQSEQADCFRAGVNGCTTLGFSLSFLLFWLSLAVSRPALSVKVRSFLGLGLLAGWFAFVGTERRTEVMGLLVAIIFVAVWRARGFVNKRIFVGGLALIAFVFLMSFLTLKPRFVQVESEISSYIKGGDQRTESIATSMGGRMEMYRIALEAIATRPLLGWGAGIKPRDLPQYAHDPQNTLRYRNFHSSYLQQVLELGFIGATLSLILVCVVIRITVFLPWRKRRSELAVLAGGLWFLYAWKGLTFTAFGYGLSNAIFVFYTAWFWVLLMREQKSLSTEKSDDLSLIVRTP